MEIEMKIRGLMMDPMTNLTISCDECVMQGTAACDDCVVTLY